MMKRTREFLKEYLPYVKLRKKHAIVTWDGLEYEVPSVTYPVANKPTLSFYSYADTAQLKPDTKLAELYNQLEFKVGHCYQNIERYSDLLQENKFTDFKIYTGWLVMNGLPVHHCWLVWKEKHLIDPGVTLIDNLYMNQAQELRLKQGSESISMDDFRKLYVSIHNEFDGKPNAEYRTFGQAAPFAFYIGTETTPNQGRRIFSGLMKEMPNHPSYVDDGMNGHGESTLQQMLKKND